MAAAKFRWPKIRVIAPIQAPPPGIFGVEKTVHSCPALATQDRPFGSLMMAVQLPRSDTKISNNLPSLIIATVTCASCHRFHSRCTTSSRAAQMFCAAAGKHKKTAMKAAANAMARRRVIRGIASACRSKRRTAPDTK